MQILETTPDSVQMAALQQAGLPIEDLDNDVPRRWWQAVAEDGWLGLIALERHGTIGLLRSLLVRAEARRSGSGRALVGTVERAAREAGCDALFLLTTDADGYFARLGYAPVERAAVPEAVRATAQFSRLCPASATVLRKPLPA
ncbi:MAG: GNAT family N-acetyltransferase [Xanthomonadales bacterium]|nr:GNAT family N-acetyltransferase [Xanthomonadales bacterium]